MPTLDLLWAAEMDRRATPRFDGGMNTASRPVPRIIGGDRFAARIRVAAQRLCRRIVLRFTAQGGRRSWPISLRR
jgi:hypothetical protein